MESVKDKPDLGAEKTPEQIESIEASMKADGIATHEKVQEDYFGFEETLTIVLPDGKSIIEHQLLNEGARRKYQNSINRDVTIQRTTGDAKMRMAPGDEKVALLEAAIVGWNLVKDGQPVTFSQMNLAIFLKKASPRIIDLIEKEVRKANSWLQSDMSVEDIDKEIESLQEMKEKKIEDEQGKDSLSKK